MKTSLRQFIKDRHISYNVVLVLLFLIIFIFIFYSTYNVARSFVFTQKQKSVKKQELKSIQNRIEHIQSESYLDEDFQREKSLREKLYMVQPGEELIIIVPEE